MVPDECDCLFQKWNGIFEIVSTVWFGRKYLEFMWPDAVPTWHNLPTMDLGFTCWFAQAIERCEAQA
ncbi:hypothetical protein GBA52_002985 [Prunus armeniaca]|nr:hypothetical protein GBA52_002985 [Prunus armeniaca]